jgi:hypothetical protein
MGTCFYHGPCLLRAPPKKPNVYRIFSFRPFLTALLVAWRRQAMYHPPMVSIVGLLGGLCFAYCGVPTAWRTIRAGCSQGTPASVAWMIFLGGILMFAYLAASYGFDRLLAANYAVETASWGVVVWFHHFPRKEPENDAARLSRIEGRLERR